jgi:hypothetical protein
MNKKRVRYNEGQWFAIPLGKGGYAIGVIVRGSYKTKGGLGYFFGPKYPNIPEDQETWEKRPEDAVLIGKFGDLGIFDGSWPLISSTRPFSREEWPVPEFGKKDLLIPGKGYIRRYEYNERGERTLIKQTVVDIKEIQGLPKDGVMGAGLVEFRLTDLLEQ